MGSIWETWRFRTAKFFPFGHPKRLPQWEALGRHGDSELLLNHFVMMSTMATTAAILKIFSRQFMTWSVDHGPSLICMSVSNFSHSVIPIRIIHMMTTMTAILKVFNSFICSRTISHIERKLCGRHLGSIKT